jgi:hypothetical protein
MVAVVFAGTASATKVEVESTTGTKLGFGSVGYTTGTGVVTVNGSGAGGHLNTLRLAPTDPADSSPAPVTDPETTGTVASNIVDGAFGRGGTFAPISGGGGLTQNTLALAGVARVCIVVAGCSSSLPLILTQNQTVGVGIGGTVTVGYPGVIRVSLVAAPWQIGTATRLQSTANGVVITRKHSGFIHGAASATSSSTAKPSGLVQLITPTQVLTKGISGNAKKLALFTSIALHFVPEPGLLLLLGSGVAGLALLGRSRMRK